MNNKHKEELRKRMQYEYEPNGIAGELQTLMEYAVALKKFGHADGYITKKKFCIVAQKLEEIAIILYGNRTSNRMLYDAWDRACDVESSILGDIELEDRGIDRESEIKLWTKK